MTERLQGRARWSHAAKCPRMGAMALLGHEPEELSERQRGRMQRGKDAQRWFGKQRLEAKYGEEGVQYEPAVSWPAPPALPIGELHPDFYISAEKMTIELKSSEAVDSMFEMSLRQAKGEVHWHPEAEAGALVFLDRDYQETDWFPVVVTEEDAEELEAVATQVVEAGRTGELPPRTCSRPQEGIGKFCPFIRECFEGWEGPPVAQMPDIAPLATEAYLAKRDLDAAKGDLGPLEERYEAARMALLEAGVPEGETVAGGVLVKHTIVRGSHSFSLSKARKSGMWTGVDDERFDAFIKQSEGHSRWSFERVGEEPLEHDFGEEAPF